MMSFSKNIEELEKIIQRLEREALPLEEAMEIFERGVALVKNCQAYLAEVQQKVMLVDEGGNEKAWEAETQEENEN
ncbi:Exodeoxyribonuclease VII small subunit [Acetomicrobium mobile DSM 13181]|uniref:Exodeoxyribonuclease 7 small subunit n=2 Tax=Acetomicrobium TaxID=49894 RepID=I4BW30_ACEMN|nr:Exodeoxyribonuclease VII small subunit [Acetomicrobium mobile DSM 13181]